jgi:carbon storage regulator CsrA
MLVLSRRPTEKILFPGINAAVQVLSVKGSNVRLGIEAPPEVVILRDELQDKAKKLSTPALLAKLAETQSRARQFVTDWDGAEAPSAEPIDAQLRTLRHLVRNRLNVTAIGLALMREQLKAGQTVDLEGTLSKIEQEMEMLRQRLDTEKAKTAVSTPKRARKAIKALLVEDDQNERELLAGFLRMSGFSVDTAGDGCDALDQLRTRERPDVVLLDMGMPRCDGATTTRAIRRDPANAGLRILAVTGHSPDEYDLEQGPGGIDRWFHKPLDPVALLRELNQELAIV